MLVTSADSGPSSARITSAPRCSTVASRSNVALGSFSVLVHLVGQRCGLLGREVAAHPPVDDLGQSAGGEVDAVREVAVANVHARADGLEDAAARVLLARVVAEDARTRAMSDSGAMPSPTV